MLRAFHGFEILSVLALLFFVGRLSNTLQTSSFRIVVIFFNAGASEGNRALTLSF